MNQQKQVNILKNFTDALAFFAALIASAFVLIDKKAFEPTEEILNFYQVETTRAYIIIACAFFVSAMLSALSRRIPSLAAPLSYIPFWLSFFYYDSELLPKRPMLFILLGLAHFAGGLISIGQWFADSREYSKNTSRSIACGFTYTALSAAFLLILERFFPYRWQLRLEKPFYTVAFMGMACGILGIAWYFLTPKEERKKLKLCLSAISSLSCLAVILIRYLNEII